MLDQPYVRLSDLIKMMEAGEIDVVQFGRPFQRGAHWTAELWNSLARDPQWPISGFVWWEPSEEALPRAGRYRSTSDARVFIVDGQQRSTALAGGAGIRPACYPAEVWEDLKGPDLQVGVVLQTTQKLTIQPLRPRKLPQIPLGLLLRATPSDMAALVESAGVGHGTHAVQFASSLTSMQSRLLETTIPVAWIHGGVRDAAESYRVLNQGSSTKLAHASEIESLYLDLVCPGVRREVLDPLRRTAARDGYGGVLTEPLINEVVQRLLPIGSRRRSVYKADPEIVRSTAERAADACLDVMTYLKERGLVHEVLLSMPAAIGVLMHLAARFPEALASDFPRRWFVHALTSGRYNATPYRANGDISAMLRTESFGAAQKVLAEMMLPATSPTPVDQGQLTGRRPGCFAQIATFYAMAAASPPGRGVPDLHDPDLRFPSSSMCLVPLWTGQNGQVERSLGNYVLATPATAKILEESRGWNRRAYERLGCGTEALKAHRLPRPSASTASLEPSEIVKQREHDLLEEINSYLECVGPLTPDEPFEKGS